MNVKVINGVSIPNMPWQEKRKKADRRWRSAPKLFLDLYQALFRLLQELPLRELPRQQPQRPPLLQQEPLLQQLP